MDKDIVHKEICEPIKSDTQTYKKKIVKAILTPQVKA